MRRVRIRRQVLLAIGAAAALGAGPAASARADVFGSISLLSASPFQQADYAHDPAIAAGGGYVVFDGSVGGVTGIWRKQLGGAGELEEVAGGDARLPSVSADGRYVSFTTNEGAHLTEITDGEPDPQHSTGEAPNVYVRDMDRGPEEEGAFQIVSAPSGSDSPLTYEPPAETSFQVERFGSIAAGRSAISDDGREVAFVTTAVSDLIRYPVLEAEEEAAGHAPHPHTPPLQVAVRNLETATTQLVSARYDRATGAPAVDPETGGPEPVPLVSSEGGQRGAVYSSSGPPAFEPLNKYKLDQQTGASISGDGSTVAWMGQQLSEQVAELPSESIKAAAAEPLWRRIEDGPQTVIRRVTGGSEPESPSCAASGEQALPPVASTVDPCQGPFNTQVFERGAGGGGVWLGDSGVGDSVPQLSDDGYQVAFLADASLVAIGEFNGKGENGDVYVANMHPGLTRRQALTPLTELASGNEADVARNGPVTDVSIAPDGQQVAFTTQRTAFPLGVPAYVSQPAAAPGLDELFDADLANQTLTRVTHGPQGGPAEHPLSVVEVGREDPYFSAHGAEDGALSPSFSAGGSLLAFSSTASNLLFGDGNTPTSEESQGDDDGADAFVVARQAFSPEPAETYVSPEPPSPALETPWTLGVTASRLSGGRVRLYLVLPATGSLHASASSSIRLRKKTKAGRGHKARLRITTAKRQVASTAGGGQSGIVTLTLKLKGAYDELAARTNGLPATVTVSFASPGHPALRRTIEVSFKTKPAPRKATKGGSR
jgi:hypothetical protein